MAEFVFGKDGVLRTREWLYSNRTNSGRHVLLPLYLTEQVIPNRFLKSLRAGVEFEDGCTVRSMFEALAPWADLMEGIACMDFAGFLEEARRPQTVPAESDEPPLAEIEIFAFGELSAVPSFDREDDLLRSEPTEHPKLRRWVPPKTKISDRLEAEVSWTYHARYEKPYHDACADVSIEACSVDYAPVSDWAHLPIRLRPAMKVVDRTVSSDFLTTKEPLFNPQHPMVQECRSDGGRLFGYEVSMDAPPATFLDAVVYGFLWSVGFCYSPAQRDDTVQEILKRKDEVDQAIEDLKTGDAPTARLLESALSDAGDDDEDEPEYSGAAADVYEMLQLCQSARPDLVIEEGPDPGDA